MSISPEAIDALVEAGATAEMIAALFKAEMGRDAARRAGNADRQRRKRERDAEGRAKSFPQPRNEACHAVPRNMALHPATARDERDEDPLSPALSPQTPQTHPHTLEDITSRAKALKARPSRRCPGDWEPTKADTQVGLDEGFTVEQIHRELAKFRDTTFSTPRSDWSATYRNWFRNSKTPRHSNIVRMPDGRPHGSSPDAKRDQLEESFRRRLAAAMDPAG